MALIREYQHNGATIRVHNDAYAHLPQDEMEKRKKAMLDRAGVLYWKQVEENERRDQEEKCGLFSGEQST